ncbi:MAG TPA: Ni/Fe-hydrogenase cytochrome b subunit [Anaeromyxobacter sp.]
MSARAKAVEGRFLTPAVRIMLVLWALGTVAGLYRFVQGLGAATAMSDGFPWGIWIAFDVVVGTGLASGGYAMALLVYVFNKGKFHPLVRPALLTSFLGYSVAGVAVTFDLGRYWNMWRIPVAIGDWNHTSILLEVALCMMAYTGVLFLELSPALLEWLEETGKGGLAAFAKAARPKVDRALPFIVAVGLVLPTMHQSSLGSLLLVAGTKVHGLWHTGLLPLLFLLTALAMGYAVIYFESIFSSVAFRRQLETDLLARLGTAVGAVIAAFLVIRFGDLVLKGRVGLLFGSGALSFFFWVETVLFAAAAWRFLQQRVRASAQAQLQAALLALFAGSIYRIDAFLTGFNPGTNWVYFPTLPELLVTLGLVATETVAYVWLVRKFPILAGVAMPETRTAPAAAAAQQGVS